MYRSQLPAAGIPLRANVIGVPWICSAAPE